MVVLVDSAIPLGTDRQRSSTTLLLPEISEGRTDPQHCLEEYDRPSLGRCSGVEASKARSSWERSAPTEKAARREHVSKKERETEGEVAKDLQSLFLFVVDFFYIHVNSVVSYILPAFVLVVHGTEQYSSAYQHCKQSGEMLVIMFPSCQFGGAR